MKILAVVGVVVLFVAANSGKVGAAEFDTDFDGAWTGSLRKIDPTAHQTTAPADFTAMPEFLEFAVELAGGNARVFVKQEGAWQEVKPGAFGVVTHKTNAVVAATDSYFAEDGRSGWVETWNFTFTEKDDDGVYAYWVRAVNNPNLVDGTHEHARFFMSRFGAMHRSNPLAAADSISVSASRPTSRCVRADAVCGSDERRIDDTLDSAPKIEQQN